MISQAKGYICAKIGAEQLCFRVLLDKTGSTWVKVAC